MEVGKLTVQRRHETGKGVARRLRATGNIPGVCYGAGLDGALPIQVNTRELKASLDPVKRHNTVIEMTVNEDSGSGRVVTVMVKDYQIDIIRRELTHVDLIAIDKDQPVEVEVPIELYGKAAGLIGGGQIRVVRHEIVVRCKPADIPAVLRLDISSLDIGDVLHVSDLTLPEGVESASPMRLALVTCSAPEAEVVEAEVAPVEGEAIAPAPEEPEKK